MRAVEDHHVDRPGVEVQQCMKLTGTNRSTGLIANTHPSRAAARAGGGRATVDKAQRKAQRKDRHSVHRRSGGYGGGPSTRSHPELGRENPQRRWYCVLRRGRVGRRQAFHERNATDASQPVHVSARGARLRATDRPIAGRRLTAERDANDHPDAGWSSPVARQAHNLKVAGSNPAPATIKTPLSQ